MYLLKKDFIKQIKIKANFLLDNPLLCSSVFLSLMILFCFNITSPDYLYADDLLFRQILDGTMSNNDVGSEYLFSINVLYANFIKFLYANFNQYSISWYDVVFLVISVFSSFFVVLKSIEILDSKHKKYILLAVYFLLLPIFIIKVQFSLVSGLINLSIALAIIQIIIKNDISQKQFIINVLYIYFMGIISFLIRPYNFYFSGISFFFLTLTFLYQRIIWRRVVRIIPLLLLLTITHISLYKFNENYYKSQNHTAELLSHNYLNFSIMDRTFFPNSETLKNIEEDLNHDTRWSIDDFLMLRYGLYYNKNIFCYECSLDLFNKTKHHLIQKNIYSYEYFRKNVKHIYSLEDTIYSTSVLLLTNLSIISLIGLYFFGISGLLRALKISALMSVLFFILGFVSKEIPFRLSYPIVLISYLLLLLPINSTIIKNSNIAIKFIDQITLFFKQTHFNYRIFSLVTALFIALIVLFTHIEINNNKISLSRDIKSALESRISHDKIYFHHPFPGYQYHTFEMPFKNFMSKTPGNLKLLAWTYLSPSFQDFLQKEKLNDFSYNICSSDRFRFLFEKNYADAIFPIWKRFLKKNYKVNVNFIIEDGFDYENKLYQSSNRVNIYKCEIIDE